MLFQGLTVTISNLTSMLRDIEPEIFWQTVSTDSWSLADVLCHLIDVEQRYRRRLRRVLMEKRPFLSAILPDSTVGDRGALADELLAQFSDARHETLTFLKDVADAGWGRTAVHETLGEVTFHLLVQYLLEHDGEHLNQIATMLQQLDATPGRDPRPATSR